MKEIDTKKTLAKILQNRISKKDLEEFKRKLKSDPDLKEDFKKELGFFMALKRLDELDLEKKLNEIFKPEIPPEERELERDR